MSNEWELVIVIPKKGDATDCKNYREITLPQAS